jgi:cobyrinic acid a,c-diamide synthase
MPDPVLRRLFTQGARQAELALVEGTLEEPARSESFCHGLPGQLGPIARALDLPIVAVLPCAHRDGFHLPRVPDEADAVFLDGVECAEDFECYKRMVDLTTKKPVIGAVESFPGVLEAIRDVPRDHPIPAELQAKLASSFLRFADLNAINALAQSRPFPRVAPARACCGTRQFRVAYAQDEAFGSYFPDTLEALEALGAELVEFSPLRDEALPPGIDLVMIGCGFPDHFADALAANLCLISAIRAHVCRGQRVYSEGGGTAYLCRSMIMGDRRVPGAGILPIDAVLLPEPHPPAPVTRRLVRGCWLGPAETEVRGYRSARWRLIPGADPLDCPSCFGSLTTDDDLFFHHHAVGGLLHLHLGALDQVVSAFAGPHPASLSLPTSRA